MRKMLLVDGNSMLFRAFYATFTRPMSTRSGIPTNAVYGFSMMMNKALQIIAPQAVLVAFDKESIRSGMSCIRNTRAAENRRRKNWQPSFRSCANIWMPPGFAAMRRMRLKQMILSDR